MNNLPNPEEILKKYKDTYTGMFSPKYPFENIIEAMKEYGTQVRDKTLDWAVKNAKVQKGTERIILEISNEINEYEDDGKWCKTYTTYPDSILAGKTHPDLEI